MAPFLYTVCTLFHPLLGSVNIFSLLPVKKKKKKFDCMASDRSLVYNLIFDLHAKLRWFIESLCLPKVHVHFLFQKTILMS